MEGYTGEVRLWGPNWAPRNWALCQGQLQSIAQNSALFSLIGTIYGGDGRTTFALPDLRGRAAIGSGQGPGLSPYPTGAMGGIEEVTLNILEIPSHTHVAVTKPKVSSANATKSQATTGSSIATPVTPNGRSVIQTYGFNDATPDVELGQSSVIVGNAGGSRSHENRQPFGVVNYIICLYGTFPSRN
ncbi:phage tail protein [Tenacibaculum sp. nBUS_03]|uniref:phage tail protein n=1 Tax=Tenacibaculum sp. nBUS_03 TaxID=3395320 RepID=UPI003EBBB3F9